MKKDELPSRYKPSKLPSGLSSAWKLWRHCCCRHGFYPLIVAPFVTASFMLDTYCSIGCAFITLDVGFRPVNDAWNKQILEVGLFNVQSGFSNASDSMYMNTLHSGCVPFDDVFKEYFVEGDKTWVMSQILGIISGCAGGVATLIVWLMVITPLPGCIFWPGVLLPASLIAFLSSGAKFLFIDIEICRSNLWLPDANDLPAETAKSCSLGMDAILSIISCTLSFACVLLICLKAPKKRELISKQLAYADVDDDALPQVQTMEESMEGSASYEIDVESQKTVASINNKRSYDLDDMSEESRVGVKSLYNDADGTIGIGRKPIMDVAPVSFGKKISKTVRKVDRDSERLRVAEPSIEYAEKDLKKIMDGNQIPRPSTPPMKKLLSLKNISNPLNDAFREPSPLGDCSNDQSSVFSPAAPSDECSFLFRSPNKSIFNDSNEFSSPIQMKSTPRKKKSSSKKRSAKKTEPTSNKSQKYDEALIQKCVIDLELSYSETERKL